MAPNSINEVAVADKVEAVPDQEYTGWPALVSSDDMYKSAPVKQVGKMINTTGSVPIIIERRGSLIIPQSTDVGQSERIE